MRRLVILSLVLATSAIGFAQGSKVTTAALKMRSGELEEAREAIDQAAEHKRTKDDAKTWNYRGEIYLRMYSSKKYTEYDSVALDRSFKSFKRSIKLDDREKYQEKNMQGIDAVRQVYFKLANNYFEQENFEEAYQAITKYLEGNSIIQDILGKESVKTDTGSLFRKGFYAQRSDRIDTAKQVYSRLVDMKYESTYLYDFYSSILRKEGKTEKALEIIRKGQEVFPSNAELIISELNIYLETGQAEEAIERFEKAIELDSTNADLHFALGTVYDKLLSRVQDSLPEKAETYKKKAIEAYKNAARIDENYFKAIYNIGVVYFNEGVEISKEMNNLPMSEQEKYERLKGERNEAFKEALPHLEKAHQLEPDDLPTMKALKEIYFRLGEMEKYKQINEAIKAKMGGGQQPKEPQQAPKGDE